MEEFVVDWHLDLGESEVGCDSTQAEEGDGEGHSYSARHATSDTFGFGEECMRTYLIVAGCESMLWLAERRRKLHHPKPQAYNMAAETFEVNDDGDCD